MNSYWPLAVLIPLTLLVLILARPLRSAIAAWASQYQDTPDEARVTAAEARKAELDNEARQGAMAEEVLVRQAQLRLEAAQRDTDAEAAKQCLPQAVEARQVALEARGKAEAEAAPELARAALEQSDSEVMRALGDAYKTFCGEYGYSNVPTFGTWIAGFNYQDWKQWNR